MGRGLLAGDARGLAKSEGWLTTGDGKNRIEEQRGGDGSGGGGWMALRCGGKQDQKLEQEHEVLGAKSNGG